MRKSGLSLILNFTKVSTVLLHSNFNFIEIPEGKTSVGKPRRRWRIILNGALKKLISGVLTGLIWFRTRTNGFFL